MNGVSVIVPTLDEKLYLGNLLGSLVNQDTVVPLEVIVVDASANSETKQVAEQFDRVLNLK